MKKQLVKLPPTKLELLLLPLLPPIMSLTHSVELQIPLDTDTHIRY